MFSSWKNMGKMFIIFLPSAGCLLCWLLQVQYLVSIIFFLYWSVTLHFNLKTDIVMHLKKWKSLNKMAIILIILRKPIETATLCFCFALLVMHDKPVQTTVIKLLSFLTLMWIYVLEDRNRELSSLEGHYHCSSVSLVAK